MVNVQLHDSNAPSKLSEPRVPVATAIRDLRRFLGASQNRMANALGLTQVAVCKYEKGAMFPTFENLRGLAVLAQKCGREDLADLFLKPLRNELQNTIEAMNGSRGVAA